MPCRPSFEDGEYLRLDADPLLHLDPSQAGHGKLHPDMQLEYCPGIGGDVHQDEHDAAQHTADSSAHQRGSMSTASQYSAVFSPVPSSHRASTQRSSSMAYSPTYASPTAYDVASSGPGGGSGGYLPLPASHPAMVPSSGLGYSSVMNSAMPGLALSVEPLGPARGMDNYCFSDAGSLSSATLGVQPNFYYLEYAAWNSRDEDSVTLFDEPHGMHRGSHHSTRSSTLQSRASYPQDMLQGYGDRGGGSNSRYSQYISNGIREAMRPGTLEFSPSIQGDDDDDDGSSRLDGGESDDYAGLDISRTPAGMFKCDHPECDGKKAFKRSEHLKRHKMTAHNPDPEGTNITCEFCKETDGKKPKYFNRRDNWKQHLKLHATAGGRGTRRTQYHPEAKEMYEAEMRRTKRRNPSKKRQSTMSGQSF